MLLRGNEESILQKSLVDSIIIKKANDLKSAIFTKLVDSLLKIRHSIRTAEYFVTKYFFYQTCITARQVQLRFITPSFDHVGLPVSQNSSSNLSLNKPRRGQQADTYRTEDSFSSRPQAQYIYMLVWVAEGVITLGHSDRSVCGWRFNNPVITHPRPSKTLITASYDQFDFSTRPEPNRSQGSRQ